MKTTYKALLVTIITIALAFVFHRMFLMDQGRDPYAVNTSLASDLMTDSKYMFLEKADAIQLTSLAVIDKVGLSILRGKDGTPYVLSDSGLEDISDYFDAATCVSIREIFGAYDQTNASIENIAVSSDAVLFYTHYRDYACVGFLYEKVLDNTENYEVLEIAQNWKLFFRLD